MQPDLYSGAEPEPSGHPGFSRLSILRTLWKRRIRIAAAWILFSVGAFVVVRMLPAVYLAEAVVLIDSQKIPEKFVSPTVASDPEERIASIRQLLLSSTVLKKIMDDYGLYRAERKTRVEEEVLDKMRNDISVTLDSAGIAGDKSRSGKDKRPPAFRIGYQSPDPVMAARVANRLADLYVEQNVKTREEQAAGTSGFLDSQLREGKKHLDEMEAAVSSYKLQHNGELPQQEQMLSAILARLQTELEANRDGLERAQQTRVVLEGNLTATAAIVNSQTQAFERALRQDPDAPPIAGLPAAPKQDNKSLEALSEQMEALRAKYKDTHPDVIQLREQVEKLKQAESGKKPDAAPARPAAPNRSKPLDPVLAEPPELLHARQQVAGLQAQLKGLDREIETRKAEQQRILRDLDRYQAQMQRLPVREQEMAQITRDYEIAKDNYKSLLDKQMAAEMALNMERMQQSERFVVLDRALVPDKPIKPKRPALYAGGAAGALALGILLGFLAELRRNVVLGEWELPPDTPVLARLPYIEVPGPANGTPAPSGKRSLWRRKRLAYASVPPPVPLG